MKRNIPYVYCICRIDQKYWKKINEELESRGYKKVKAFVPAVKILKKSKAGKNIYEEVPLLFNYGFVRMKSDKAYDRPFLNKIKRDIPGILGFMKSPETMFPRKKRARIDNAEDFDDFSMVATVTKEEVKYYKERAKKNQVFSADDVVNVPVGSYVTLKGYPFEGIEATIDDVNLTTRMVTVTIYPERGSMVIQVPMDSVFYSVYQNYDENILMSPDKEIDVSQIADGSTEELLNSKQY